MVFVIAALLLPVAPSAFAQVYPTWEGGGTNWSDNNNWNPDYAYGQLQWTGNGSSTSWNDLSSPQSQWRFYFSGGKAYTLGGNQVNFYDFGGGVGGILSDSTALQTVNMNLSFEDSGSRAMFIYTRNSGGLTFGGSVNTGGNVTALGIGGKNTAAVMTFNGALTGTKPIVVGTNSFDGDGTDIGNTRAVFAASNNYTGTTTVANGALTLANSYALGDTSAGTTVNSGATLYLSNGVSVANEALTISGTGISSGGALRSVSGSNAYTGLITANSALTSFGAASGATLVVGAVNSGGQEFWIVGDGTTIVSGGATNSGSGTAFVKTNAGTAILSASNAWSGDEYIREGTVVLSNNNAFGTAGKTYLGAADSGSSATATITLGSSAINSNAINVVGTGTGVRTLGYQTASGTGTQLGAIELNNSSLAFNIATGGTVLFGGGVSAYTGGTDTNRLAIDGGGTLIVTNAGTGIASTDRYQVRIGNGTLVIGAGTIVARTNVSGLGHALDLGVDLSGNIVNATSTLAASNGVTVSNSIFVSTTNNSARVLSVAGAGTATYSGPIALNNANLTVTATNASDNVWITGAITNFSGSAAANNGLIKTGAGTLVLSGPSTYGGTTWVNAGVLRAVTNANAMGTTNATLVLNGGNLELIAQGGNVSWNRNMTLSNSATITMDSLVSGESTRNMSMGTLTMAGAHTLSLAKGTNYASGNPVLYFNTVTLGASGAAFVNGASTQLFFTNGIVGTNTSFSVSSEYKVYVENAISLGSGSITKTGAGLLELRSSNNSTGGIDLREGQLLLGNNYALGDGVLSITNTTGITTSIEANNGTTTNAWNNGMVWNGNFSFGEQNTTTNYHMGTGSVSLGNSVTVSAKTYALIVGGAIGDGGSGYSLTKVGTGTLIMSASNTYTGGTFVGVGALALTGAGNLDSTSALTLTTNNSTTRVLFDISGISGSSITIGSLSSDARGTNAAIDLGSKTLIVGDSSSTTFAGYMSNSGSFVKQGSGTLTLSGSNSYTGTTTINGGTLQVGTNTTLGQIGTGNITMASNSVLAFNRSGTVTAANAISGTGDLQQIGSGTLVLAGSSSFGGSVLITNGTLLMSNNNALGASSNVVTLGASNALVTVSLALGDGITNANAITVVASTNSTSHWRELDVLSAGQTATQLGTINLDNTVGTNTHLVFKAVTNSTLIFGGGINVAANTNTFYGRLIVDGGGTVIMTNNGSVSTNTSQGLQVRVANGSLVIGEGSINGRTDTGNRGIDLGVNTQGSTTSTSAGLYASNGVTINETIYSIANTPGTRFLGIAGAGTATFNGQVALRTAGLTVSAGEGGTAVFSTNIIDQSSTGALSNTLTKIGAGTVVLARTNTYSGATIVKEGTLRVTGVISNTNGANTVTVTNTGVLAGSGKIANGTTTIEAGGTISPGNSPGTIYLSNTVFGTNGHYNWQLYDADGVAGATDGYDWISGNGGLNITAGASDKFNINLWTLSGVGPDVNGSALNFDSGSTYQWTLGTWAQGITNFDASYFSLNTFATNGTGGFANAFTGTFSLTSSNNSIFLNYAGAGGVPIYSAGAGTWSTNFTPALYQGAEEWIFDGDTGGEATNDIASGTINTLGTLTFSNTAGSYTLSAASGSAGYDSASALAITGNIVNNSASAQTINLALGFDDAATINASAGNMTFGGAISNGTSLTFTGASNNTVSGAISGAGAVIKDGAGVLVLSASNDFSGGTTLEAGTLRVGNNAALGTGTLVINGGTLAASSGTARTLTNSITLGGNVQFGDATGTGNLSLLGAVDLGSSTRTLTVSNSRTTLEGVISGTGGLTKQGAGTLRLTASNTYSGTTTLSAGELYIDHSSALGTGGFVQTGAGSLLTVDASGTITNAMSIYNVSFVDTVTLTGAKTLNDTTTITVDAGDTVTEQGVVGGSGGLTKEGAGELVLNGSANNTYTGATVVNGGTLVLENSSGNAINDSSGITVNTGGTLVLGASNQIGDSIGLILNGGTFLVGAENLTEDLGTLTLSASSTIDLGGYGASGLRTLTFDNSSAITWTGTLTITNWQGVALQTSDVTKLLFGEGGLTSTQLSQIVFASQGINGGTLIGGEGELVPVPEPQVYLAAVAILGVIGWRERRRLKGLLCRGQKLEG